MLPLSWSVYIQVSNMDSQRDTRPLHLPSFKNCTNIYCNLNMFIFIANNSN